MPLRLLGADDILSRDYFGGLKIGAIYFCISSCQSIYLKNSWFFSWENEPDILA